MACNYGWDWGPDLVTAGIWREARVERWRTARLAAVRTLVTVVDGIGRVEVHADVVRDTAATLTIRADCEGRGVEADVVGGAATLVVDVPDPALWWPRGYGEQPLSDLRVELLRRRRRSSTRRDQRIGFRSVELDTTPDADGTPFALRVNGKPVLVKGANWIPDDCFPHRVDRDRYATRDRRRDRGGRQPAARLGRRPLRERRLLRRLRRDRRPRLAGLPVRLRGVLRGGAAARRGRRRGTRGGHPAQPAPQPGRLERQQREPLGLRRLGLATLELGDRTWGRGYYLELLPALVAGWTRRGPYSPGSPWSFDERRHPNDPNHGTMHIWDVWNRVDYTAYRSSAPRFVAEFGYQGPPAWSTLTARDPRRPADPDVARDAASTRRPRTATSS